MPKAAQNAPVCLGHLHGAASGDADLMGELYSIPAAVKGQVVTIKGACLPCMHIFTSVKRGAMTPTCGQRNASLHLN